MVLRHHDGKRVGVSPLPLPRYGPPGDQAEADHTPDKSQPSGEADFRRVAIGGVWLRSDQPAVGAGEVAPGDARRQTALQARGP
jgi:hypothetical protein